MERGLDRNVHLLAGRWRSFLLVSTTESSPDEAAGFLMGAYVPQLGGYASYVGVRPEARRGGHAAELFETFFDSVRHHARETGQPLPLTVWESHRPGPSAGEAERSVWAARTRLFDRLGAHRIDGLKLFAPNYTDRDAADVELELFVRPHDEPAESLDARRLREVAAAVYGRVYRLGPQDARVQAVNSPRCTPRLSLPGDPADEPPAWSGRLRLRCDAAA